MDILEHNDKTSLKTKIILFLSTYPEISAKRIYNHLNKFYNLNITYQAAFKALKELSDNKIVLKNENHNCSLNIDWIRNQIAFFRQLEAKAMMSKEKKEKVYIAKNLKIITCYDLKELDEVFQQNVMELQDEVKADKTYWKTPHCWWINGYPIQEYEVIKNYGKKELYAYGLVTRDTKEDANTLNFYKGKNIKMSIKNSENDNEVVQVIGDYVMICDLDDKIISEMDEIYKSNDFNRDRLMDLILTKHPYELKILKNKRMAEAYKFEISGERE